MTSFKRWSGTGAIVLVALALIACPSAVEIPATVAKEIGDMSFDHDATVASKITLTAYFNVTEPVYSAKSSNTKVATASVTGAELTVTPVGPGSANVTVTAKGEEGSVAQTFGVTVASPPVTPEPDPTPPPQLLATIPSPIGFANADAEPIARALSLFFSGAASYNAMSHDTAVATATIADGAATVTPVGPGSTVVVITAINAGGTLSQSVVVNVGAPPPAPLVPVNIVGTIASQNFAYDDSVGRPFMLSDYFSGATAYTVSSSNMAVATAAEAGGMLTVTPVGPGFASISVTASNDDTRTPDSALSFSVSVDEPPKPPVLKMGASFMDIRMSARDTDDSNKVPFELDDYFEDPDGFTLIFKTTTSDEMTVAVYPTPAQGVTPELAAMATSDDVTLEAVAAGTATITIVATDASGMSDTQTFMVTVIEDNDAPTSTNVALPDGLTMLTADDRLHSVGEKSMTTVLVDLNLHFTDANETPTGTETLEFDAMSSDMEVATVSLMRTGNAAVPREHNVMVTAVGPGTATITLIATDSFGKANEGTAKTFDVQVNNRPAAGDLADYMGFMNMAVLDDVSIDLDDYFTDADTNDDLTCHFLTDEHLTDAADRTAGVAVTDDNMLTVTAQKIGMMDIEVWCADDFQESDRATVSVEVDRGN